MPSDAQSSKLIEHDDLSLRESVLCRLGLHRWLLLDEGDLLAPHVDHGKKAPLVGCRRCGYKQEGVPAFWIDETGPHLRLGGQILSSQATLFAISMVLAALAYPLLQISGYFSSSGRRCLPVQSEFETAIYLVAKARPHTFPAELELFETHEKALEWIESEGVDTTDPSVHTTPAGEHEAYKGPTYTYAVYEREVRD